MIRVVVVDDQPVVRDGLTLLLGLAEDVCVVGQAADGAQAVDVCERTRPDVVLMDLRMPRIDGVEATRRLRERLPGTEVVVLTTYADDTSVLAALRAGARGYLTKDAQAAEIEQAVRAAVDGRTQLDPAVQARLVELVANPGAGDEPAGGTQPPVRLTERETDVLSLLAEGLSNREIARRLVVTEATVKTHVNNLFAKLGVTTRAQAVAWAHRAGLAGA